MAGRLLRKRTSHVIVRGGVLYAISLFIYALHQILYVLVDLWKANNGSCRDLYLLRYILVWCYNVLIACVINHIKYYIWSRETTSLLFWWFLLFTDKYTCTCDVSISIVCTQNILDSEKAWLFSYFLLIKLISHAFKI